jgi:hypothetical protein
MNNYSQLSDEYIGLFRNNLQSFCSNILEIGKSDLMDKQYSLFFPSFGTKDKVQFIIYGQATNGWIPNFMVNNIKDSLVQEAVEYSNTYNPGEKNPLDWVNTMWGGDTNLARSFFWNVTYKLINKFNAFDNDSHEWCTKTMWSNLMKISPSKGSNPNNDEWNAQLEGSRLLLQKELEEIQPEFAIFLTNWNWVSDLFRHDDRFEINEHHSGEFIHGQGYYNKTRLIVAKRTFVGSNERCVKDIIEILN